MATTDPIVTEAARAVRAIRGDFETLRADEMDEQRRREFMARALADQDYDKLFGSILATINAEIAEGNEPLPDEQAVLDLMRLCAGGLDRDDSGELVARAREVVEAGRRLMREFAIVYLA